MNTILKTIAALLLITAPTLGQTKKELDIKSVFCVQLADSITDGGLSPVDGEETPNNKGKLYWLRCENEAALFGLEYDADRMAAVFIENGRVTMLRYYLLGKVESALASKHRNSYSNCIMKVQFKRGHHYVDITKR